MTHEKRNGRICKNCDNFDSRLGTIGTCRLNPPVLVTYLENSDDPTDRGPVFSYPDVHEKQYCGQFTEQQSPE